LVNGYRTFCIHEHTTDIIIVRPLAPLARASLVSGSDFSLASVAARGRPVVSIDADAAGVETGVEDTVEGVDGRMSFLAAATARTVAGTPLAEAFDPSDVDNNDGVVPFAGVVAGVAGAAAAAGGGEVEDGIRLMDAGPSNAAVSVSNFFANASNSISSARIV
jgi:hypothetical protein